MYTYNNPLNLAGGVLVAADAIETFAGTVTVAGGTNTTLESLWNNKPLTISGVLTGPSNGTITLQQAGNSPGGGGNGTDYAQFTNTSTNNTFAGTVLVNGTLGYNTQLYVAGTTVFKNATVNLAGNSSNNNALVFSTISNMTIGRPDGQR